MEKVVLFFLIWYMPLSLLGEGTKELRPAEENKGNLLLYESYSQFGLYDAPPENQIKINVASVDETIYFGLNNKNGGFTPGYTNDNGPFVPNVPFRIVSPSGNIVYESVIPAAGEEGHIPNWTEAVNGPAELGTPQGYDAIEIDPDEIGDYIIEFNPAAVNNSRLNIHLFDITVADNNNQAIPGRLHSQGWQISAEEFTHPFYGKVYPYNGKDAVYEVDFNGFNPLVFVLNFNSQGTGATEDFIEARKSVIGKGLVPEYEVFLNPPDEEVYPVDQFNVDVQANVYKKDCMTSDFCFDVASSSKGYLDGYLDFNNNGVFDEENGEVQFEEYVDGAQQVCVEWDGRDANGNPIEAGNYKLRVSFGFGIMHLPMYDVEHNRNGYKIDIVRPADGVQPTIFWDDSQITAGSTLGDPKVNMEGCKSGSSGCHKWENRGAVSSGQTDEQETINTWWFSEIVYDSLIYFHPGDHKVELSYHPVDLVQGDTSVCIGDSLNFYVYNNGQHFDLTKYTYDWTFNSTPLEGDIRQQKQQINGISRVIVKATDTSALSCVSYDTLNISVVEPVTLKAIFDTITCLNPEAFIDVDVLTGPPDIEYFWNEFPGQNSDDLNGISAGTYHLLVKDDNYSASCALDTAFTIVEDTEIVVADVSSEGSVCYEPSGVAEVIIEDLSQEYEYSWDGAPFGSNSSMSSLSVGQHKVKIRNQANGCETEEPFIIPTVPLTFDVHALNERCDNNSGQISLDLPEYDFDIFWDGTLEDTRIKQNLSSGTYDINVSSTEFSNCSFDTTITIFDSVYTVDADFTTEDLDLENDDNRKVQFINLSKTAVSYSWDFGDGQESQEKHPLHSYQDYDEYVITLDVLDEHGCPGTARKAVPIAPPCGVRFPNAFSPNGDHINNTIGIIGHAPKVELKIFNRWGEVIFRTFEIPNRWDGTYRGKEAPIGAYPYILDWECPNGDGEMVKHRKVGDVSLIR